MDIHPLEPLNLQQIHGIALTERFSWQPYIHNESNDRPPVITFPSLQSHINILFFDQFVSDQHYYYHIGAGASYTTHPKEANQFSWSTSTTNSNHVHIIWPTYTLPFLLLKQWPRLFRKDWYPADLSSVNLYSHVYYSYQDHPLTASVTNCSSRPLTFPIIHKPWMKPSTLMVPTSAVSDGH